MNIVRYRLTLLSLCITLTGVSFFTVFRGDLPEIYINEISSSGFFQDMIAIGRSDPLPIPIDIRTLSSQRYLYTLIQELQKKSMINDGKTLPIEIQYQSLGDTRIDGGDVIFTFTGSSPIRLPISSFFFDRYNHPPVMPGIGINGTGETISGSGNKRKQKVIALTFDDGPSGKYTLSLLDILAREGVKVTFFVLGSRAREHPEILQREHQEGHEIGNHSFSHTAFTKLSTGAIQDELYQTDQAIYQAIGEYPTLFRPPYGAINTGMTTDIAMPFALWSIDTQDWKTKNIKKNIASIASAKSGDIIIMHDIHETSVASIEAMIRILKARGFTFVTVSDILELSPNHQQIGKRCYKRGDCR